ncbi:hypothetical protein P152DRAFT_148165 [Eremomyces bilateralis CBS 781.70]|uniref:DUF3500 domain-containing protein n=1 Tax=Eremomyces bilateralis CBS 781.70 TaxID=1392243 RepID=A0A6G1FVE9_9PEZI|nr:uncharacterized protein P152DRAFT_148165 [Eremomyces bilateralis CBS 781.70]KAF1809764.1 hypothetical protein P152DRAFT_148165 [Eremomyces bilateralis CBS 781.70]
MVKGYSFEEASAGFRNHLPDLNTPRFINAKSQSPYEYSNTFRDTQHPPWLYSLTKAWEQLLEEPYKGVTVDGSIRHGLFKHQDEDVPMANIVSTVKSLLSTLTPDQASQFRHPLNSKAWRSWSNPEFLLRPLGLRLEEVSESVNGGIHRVMQATLSPEGYQKAVATMRINHFLGELVSLPKIMNDQSYNFLLFGEPSESGPWGWSLYGHHLCLNVFLQGTQIFISPTFTGAEPNVIDSGKWRGTEILHTEGALGLTLMQSLPVDTQRKAQVFEELRDPRMLQSGDLTKDRWNRDDQRHMCGAFRDNRIVPYEGACASSFTTEQKQLILEIANEMLLYIPGTARKRRLELIASHFNETYFCWIGQYGDADPFYYRIQSPVIILEFDHHSGVFLTNEEPGKFHTHTIVRTPNQGDYGCALRKQEDVVL